MPVTLQVSECLSHFGFRSACHFSGFRVPVTFQVSECLSLFRFPKNRVVFQELPHFLLTCIVGKVSASFTPSDSSLVILFVSSFASNLVSVNISGFVRRTSASLNPIFLFFHFNDLQVGFAEKLCQLVVPNFFLRTCSYAQITLPVQSSFQSFFNRNIQWLQMRRRVR